jgi:hypothetical protein
MKLPELFQDFSLFRALHRIEQVLALVYRGGAASLTAANATLAFVTSSLYIFLSHACTLRFLFILGNQQGIVGREIRQKI